MTIRMAGVALTGMMLSAGALAQGFIEDPAIYAGAGYSRLSLDDDGLFRGLDQDDDDQGVHILGGYRFNRYLAAELSVRDLGEYRASGSSFRYQAEFTGTTVGVVGFLPLGDRVSLYGRLGVGYITLDDEVTTASYRISDDDSGGTSSLAAGVEFRPMGRDQLAVRLGWESHFFTVETRRLINIGGTRFLVEEDYDQRIDSFGLDLVYYFSL